MNTKKIDVAGLLTVAGLALTVLAGIVEIKQREQDNHEIAAEVVAMLKEEK